MAVDGLSFSVPAGCLFGFVGRNGAGKTTTMRIICGLLAPDDGTMSWRGAPIDGGVRERIGYMPESAACIRRCASATSWSTSRYCTARRTSRDERPPACGWIGLGSATLVLDEPFAGLDPIAMDGMAELLREEAARGAPVIFSSHQLELVEQLCESVAIIDHGRLLAWRFPVRLGVCLHDGEPRGNSRGTRSDGRGRYWL
jgi:ABC-2 type transport system ATP-binding protein